MTISPLPEYTRHLLGASSVICSPDSLVKELLENAIDAKATSVELMISANTTDRIEVRDNGQGIHPADLAMLGRRGHTSKLKCFDELKEVGVTTLGFRGQALAGANALGSVSITTRTGQDSVATTINLRPREGGILKEQCTSTPVGTTVAVTGLFKNLPVREKMARKDALKTITRVKHLLSSYALARPTLRLSLKMLGNPQIAWSYSPRGNAGAREAVLQIFGTELASQCQERSISTKDHECDINEERHGTNQSPEGHAHYSLKGLLPTPDADGSKVSKGSFISVNSRPLSAIRGTPKRLVRISRTEAAKVRAERNSTQPNDAFIQLDIQCPAASYDVNVEPTKSDVIFADERPILELFESLCRQVYGKLDTDGDLKAAGGMAKASEAPASRSEVRRVSGSPETLPTDIGPQDLKVRVGQGQQIRDYLGIDTQHHSINGAAQPRSAQLEDSSGFSMLLTSGRSRHVGHQERNQVTEPLSGTNLESQWAVSMSAPVEDSSDDEAGGGPYDSHRNDGSLQHPVKPEEGVAAEEEATNPLEGLNPWTIAKLNTCHLGTESDTVLPSPESIRSNRLGPGQAVWEDDGTNQPASSLRGLLPGDIDIAPGGMEFYQQDARDAQALLSPTSSPAAQSQLLTFRVTPQNANGHGMDNGFGISPSSSRTRQSRKQYRQQRQIPLDHEQSQTLDSDSLWQMALTSGKKPPRSSRRRNRLEDSVHGDGNLMDGTTQSSLNADASSFTRAIRVCQDTNHDFGSSQYTQTRPAHHPMFGSAASDSWLHDPASSGSSKAIEKSTAAHDLLPDKEPLQTGLSEEDPRCYMFRRQKSMAEQIDQGAPKKLRRLKTDMLPLESVPRGYQTHDIIKAIEINSAEIEASENTILCSDSYVLTGVLEKGLNMSLGGDDIANIEERLRRVLSSWADDTGNTNGVEIRLQSVMKGKAVEKQV